MERLAAMGVLIRKPPLDIRCSYYLIASLATVPEGSGADRIEEKR